MANTLENPRPTGSEIFADYLDEIKNSGIRELVVLTMDHIGISNPYFFSAPASSSGKYHPQCSNVRPGGLVRHVFRAIELGKHLARGMAFSQTEIDIVVAALIMHDIWKNDYRRHASRAGEEIMKTIQDNPHLFESASFDILVKIVQCVRMHMGPWSEKKIRKDMQDYSQLELIVYLADYISSRPDILTSQDDCSLELVKSFCQ